MDSSQNIIGGCGFHVDGIDCPAKGQDGKHTKASDCTASIFQNAQRVKEPKLMVKKEP